MISKTKLVQGLVIFFQVLKHMTLYPIYKLIRRHPRVLYSLIAILIYYIYVRTKVTLPPEISSRQRIIFTDKQTIKIASYSFGCGSRMLLGRVGACATKAARLVSGVTDYDIVLLQDVYIFHMGPLYLFGNVKFLNRELAEEGFKYRATYKRTMKYIFLSHNNGVASFSRLPIVDSFSKVFKCASFQEFPAGRGYNTMEIEIRTPTTSRSPLRMFSEDFDEKQYLKHSLFLFNVHLDAHSEITRTCQLKELYSDIIRVTSAEHFVVISGNLNINALREGSTEYFQLQRMMELAGLAEVFSARDATHQDGAHYDYMFTSKNIRILRREIRGLATEQGDDVSEHFGLFSEIQLIIKPPPSATPQPAGEKG